MARTITVLVIACPHALGLAIPLVISIATSLAARNGILVKDRLALERIRSIDTVLFDETSTLTKGEHAVVDVVALGGPALVRELGLDVPLALREAVERWQRRGAAVLYVVRDGEIVAALALEDQVRPESREAVAPCAATVCGWR